MEFTSVKRRKVHEDVAEQIENQIISGALEVGTTLPSERSLMESFNVGRPAVREALLLLQRSGFVAVSSNGRPVVARPTASKILEQLSGSARILLSSKEGEHALQDSRRLFEAGIARHAAEEATPEDIDQLGKALEANRQSLDDLAAFERTDLGFHRTLAEIGGNPVFGALHEAMSDWLSMQRHVALRVSGVAENALASHQKIFDAVAARQPEQAWQAMDEHLREIKRRYHQGEDDGE
ncbi:MAG: FCD domain-containing protein [Hyphomicrobiales bacterium]|nr:FCD domain-containing protein [Hyphomicrobiales bacterium]